MHMGWQCSKTAATDNKEEKKKTKRKKNSFQQRFPAFKLN